MKCVLKRCLAANRRYNSKKSFHCRGNDNGNHSGKIIRIQSFSCPCFPAFRLNMDRHFVSLCIQSKDGKIRTRKTPNTDNFLNEDDYDVLFLWNG